MQYRKWIMPLLGSMLLSAAVSAQDSSAYEKALNQSYALYEKGEWKELIAYGKAYLRDHPDFILLRLRMGYAAFMTGNYSEALQNYDAVLRMDSYQESAHYYSWLCRRYLNQEAQSDAHLKYLSASTLQAEKIKSFAVTRAGTELSFKSTAQPGRGNGMYTRFDLHTRVSKGFRMQHSFALFNQTLAEPKLTAVTGNLNIPVNQKEYYNKTEINLSRHWQAIAAYHYLYTPFNNFIYHNQVLLMGLRYNGYSLALQADAAFGQMTDTSQQQVNLRVEWMPRGNMDLYCFSTLSIRSRNGQSGVNLKQVLGARLLSRLWLEANATLGSFSNLLENDALYVYNAIDPNRLKAGATAYITLGSRCTAQLGYTFENRSLFRTNQTFQQHSITGGITCQF